MTGEPVRREAGVEGDDQMSDLGTPGARGGGEEDGGDEDRGGEEHPGEAS